MNLGHAAANAVRLMLRVARADALESLARSPPRQGLAYGRRILTVLKRAGLLLVKRGPAGGYMLARPPRDITLEDIVEAVSDDLDCGRPYSSALYDPTAKERIEDLLETANEEAREPFRSVTLADLLEECAP